MNTFSDTKDEIKDRAHAEMRRKITMPAWSTREKIVLAGRILFDDDQVWGLSGQITARCEERPELFYTQQWGLGFDELMPEHILLVDSDLNVIPESSDRMASPANRFHAWLYKVRPDVNCIIHTHSPYVSALSMIGVPIISSHMDSSVLYGDCAFLREWPGVPVGNSEGEIISKAIGDKRAIFLAHHGQLVAGATVQEACILAVAMERAARLQLLASASGQIEALPGDLLAEAHDWLLGPKRVDGTFAYYGRRALRRYPGCLGAAAGA